MGIAISSNGDCGVTVISNQFIDHFMPHANGTCVKTYLYLLRQLSMPDSTDLSVSSIAASLGDTEGDILRSIAWLEQYGLLQAARAGGEGNEGDITGIVLLNQSSAKHASVVEVPVMNVPVIDIPVIKKPDSAAILQSAPSAKEPSAGFMDAAAEQKQADLEIPTYSKSQIEKLSSNEEVKWVMSIAERYLERLLNPADIQLIIYLYESAGFPADLILYLYEYCASRDKKSPSYIEKVALNWAQEGIRTVEQAETSSLKYNAHYQAVVRAFGMNRMPGAAEQNYIDRWAKKFGFSADMIEEACSRSLLSTQRPDFKYADRILENWHKKGIATKQDILRADQIHSQTVARTAANKTESFSRAVPKNNNRFNAFPQRSYSGEEYSSMEQRLLNRSGN